ncbi:MAG: peptide chain release factor N(5)-glutamine methyltransferase [Betaproteobacteria bacterium HGW-Betaproteobacteria-20]|nr:MAG: peptide chain release factor N(5)-glutamine methyltransferase [Betaproteobacteria bacterium HGW-Betaproteobacteria-20]
MTSPKTIQSTLLAASAQLKNDDAKLEAQLFLQYALKVNHAWLIAHENDALQPNIHAEFEALLNRRLHGEPMAYILGCREFYGLELMVTPDTLIPRPDTETLVEAVLGKIPLHENDEIRILDLGTGTGAIALAIAKHRPQASVIAVDASTAALEIARKNAENLNIVNVQFVLSHWFDNLDNENNNVNQFDVIVSNPPYIEQNDAHLTQGDLRFEPLSALVSGVDGLDDIRQIINNCLIHLKPQGWLMLEHGYNQAELVTDLMAQTGLTNLETIRDIAGNNRVTIGKNPLIVSTHWD